LYEDFEYIDEASSRELKALHTQKKCSDDYIKTRSTILNKRHIVYLSEQFLRHETIWKQLRTSTTSTRTRVLWLLTKTYGLDFRSEDRNTAARDVSQVRMTKMQYYSSVMYVGRVAESSLFKN
jgi:hypothetical protein